MILFPALAKVWYTQSTPIWRQLVLCCWWSRRCCCWRRERRCWPTQPAVLFHSVATLPEVISHCLSMLQHVICHGGFSFSALSKIMLPPVTVMGVSDCLISFLLQFWWVVVNRKVVSGKIVVIVLQCRTDIFDVSFKWRSSSNVSGVKSLPCSVFGRHTIRWQFFEVNFILVPKVVLNLQTCVLRFFQSCDRLLQNVSNWHMGVFLLEWQVSLNFGPTKFQLNPIRQFCKASEQAIVFKKWLSLRESRRSLVLSCTAASWNQKHHGMRREGETLWNLSAEKLVYYSLVLSIRRIHTESWSVPSLYSDQ